ncbi:D-alanine--D-alanine ligase [Patescibacteria group bacterium]|nr:D-alanine--D-alanine ligase [Patescibacteria group bacterium]
MKKLAVIYGGITTEHEVSIITAVALMENVDQKKYQLIPVYIDKSGQWWTGDELMDMAYYQTQDLFNPMSLKSFYLSHDRKNHEIDVAILCFHGGYGESGNIQGLLELAGIPYQGPEVLGSSACFDKIITRQILASEGIGQTEYIWFNDYDWQENKKEILGKIKKLGMPVFVKPSRSGSSIGIARVTNENALEKVIEQVLQFDYRILVEAEIKDCIEVNVSVLGGDKIEVSITEQPIKTDQFLSFTDKYEKGGGKKSGMASANRRIPAPISANLTTKVQKLAKKIFRIFDCTGVVRIDFFVDPSEETIYVTELNTIPGSMSCYLWAASGINYPQLVDRLVEIAQERFDKKKKLIQSFESNILEKKS